MRITGSYGPNAEGTGRIIVAQRPLGRRSSSRRGTLARDGDAQDRADRLPGSRAESAQR